MGVRVDIAFEDPADVARNGARAMGVYAAEICFDLDAGRDSGVGFRHTRRFEEVNAKGVQSGVGDGAGCHDMSAGSRNLKSKRADQPALRPA